MNLQDELIAKGLATANQLPKPVARALKYELSSRLKQEINEPVTETEKLTPAQIQNWREVLLMNPQIGAWALVMPDEEVQRLKDHFQELAGKL